MTAASSGRSMSLIAGPCTLVFVLSPATIWSSWSLLSSSWGPKSRFKRKEKMLKIVGVQGYSVVLDCMSSWRLRAWTCCLHTGWLPSCHRGMAWFRGNRFLELKLKSWALVRPMKATEKGFCCSLHFFCIQLTKGEYHVHTRYVECFAWYSYSHTGTRGRPMIIRPLRARLPINLTRA